MVRGISKTKYGEPDCPQRVPGESLAQQELPEVAHVVRLIPLARCGTYKHHHWLMEQLRLCVCSGKGVTTFCMSKGVPVSVATKRCLSVAKLKDASYPVIAVHGDHSHPEVPPPPLPAHPLRHVLRRARLAAIQHQQLPITNCRHASRTASPVPVRLEWNEDRKVRSQHINWRTTRWCVRIRDEARQRER